MADEMQQHVKEFADKVINLMNSVQSLKRVKWREQIQFYSGIHKYSGKCTPYIQK